MLHSTSCTYSSQIIYLCRLHVGKLTYSMQKLPMVGYIHLLMCMHTCLWAYTYEYVHTTIYGYTCLWACTYDHVHILTYGYKVYRVSVAIKIAVIMIFTAVATSNYIYATIAIASFHYTIPYGRLQYSISVSWYTRTQLSTYLSYYLYDNHKLLWHLVIVR